MSLQQQMKSDQMGGQENMVIQSDMPEILGAYSSGKSYKQWQKTVYETNNSILSNAGSNELTPGLSITMNIQEQNVVHVLNKYFICFDLACQNGYIPNYLSILQCNKFSHGKKSLSTGNQTWLSMMKFQERSAKSIRKYACGLGLKADGCYNQAQVNQLQLAPLIALGGGTIATLIIQTQSQIQQVLNSNGFTRINTVALVAGDAAAFIVAYNDAITTILSGNNPNYNIGVIAIDGANYAALVASINANTVALFNNAGLSFLGNYNTPAKRWSNYEQNELANQAVQCRGPFSTDNDVTHFRYRVAIPLHYVSCEIDRYKKQKYMVILQGGNTMQFNFSFNLPNLCMIATQAGVLDYRIKNLQLVRTMSPDLTPEIMNNLNNSSVIYQCLRYYPANVVNLNESVNLTLAVPQNSRPVGLLFAFFTNQAYTSTNTPTNAVDGANENLVTKRANTYSRLQCPLHFMPQLPVRQIIVNVGGASYTVNAFLQNQIESVQYGFGLKSQAEKNALEKQIKAVYKVDFTRFPEDAFGSALDTQPLNIQIQFILNQDQHSYTISGQSQVFIIADNLADNNVASIGQYECRAYLELIEPLEQQNGIIKI